MWCGGQSEDKREFAEVATIADALSLGALRREAVTLTPEQIAYVESIRPLGVPLNVLTTIAEYYIANKPYDSDWCVPPVPNIEAYLCSLQ